MGHLQHKGQTLANLILAGFCVAAIFIHVIEL